MELAPFHLTPLVKDVLAALVRSDKALTSHEVSQCTGNRHDYVVKALMRMQRTGWIHISTNMPPPETAGFMLKDEYRTQAKTIVEEGS